MFKFNSQDKVTFTHRIGLLYKSKNLGQIFALKVGGSTYVGHKFFAAQWAICSVMLSSLTPSTASPTPISSCAVS